MLRAAAFEGGARARCADGGQVDVGRLVQHGLPDLSHRAGLAAAGLHLLSGPRVGQLGKDVRRVGVAHERLRGPHGPPACHRPFAVLDRPSLRLRSGSGRQLREPPTVRDADVHADLFARSARGGCQRSRLQPLVAIFMLPWLSSLD